MSAGDTGAVPDEGGEPDKPAGRWSIISFIGHNEYTGYVTETVKHGQPAYHVDLPELVWGGNPHSWVEYAATAWFSERPVTEAYARRAWEAQCRAAAERKRQQDEWDRVQEQRALTAGGDDDYGWGDGDDDD